MGARSICKPVDICHCAMGESVIFTAQNGRAAQPGCSPDCHARDYNRDDAHDYNGTAWHAVKTLYLVADDACLTISSRFCLFATAREKMQKQCKHLIFVNADYGLGE